MSQHAKSIIAAFAAVVFIAITAWQQVGAGPFHWVDLIPVAVVVVGAIQTHVIPNVPELPWAKSVTNGSSAVLSAIATLVAGDPSGVTAGKLLTVATAAFLVWFVPEFGGPELAPVTDDGAHVVTDLPQSSPPAASWGSSASVFDRDELVAWLKKLEDDSEPATTAGEPAVGPSTPSGSSSANALAPLLADPPTAPMAAVAAGPTTEKA